IHSKFAPRLHIVHEWPKLDAGGLEALDAWMERNPETRLIVVDVLKKVRPKRKKNSQLYEEDYEHLEPLQKLAQRYEVAIVVVHHTRKSAGEDVFDEISGSIGMTAAPDAVLVLHRSRSEADAEVWITGKDIEEAHLALQFE